MQCYQYNQFMKSGHAFNLNKVVNGKPPGYPFTTLPELPEGVTWDDVTYVIGGYHWKARFVGKDGKTALLQKGLNFACKSCHVEGGTGKIRSERDLIESAFNYNAGRPFCPVMF